LQIKPLEIALQRIQKNALKNKKLKEMQLRDSREKNTYRNPSKSYVFLAFLMVSKFIAIAIRARTKLLNFSFCRTLRAKKQTYQFTTRLAFQINAERREELKKFFKL